MSHLKKIYNHFSLYLSFVCCFLYVVLHCVSPSNCFAVDFNRKEKIEVNEYGYIQLTWPNKNVFVEVQKSQDASFKKAVTIYEGLESSTFLSGLEDGDYYFRIREQGKSWSEPYSMTVKHPSLILAFLLSGVGAVVFLCTVCLVVFRKKID